MSDTPEARAEIERVSAALALPFDVTEVKFKPQSISGNRALAVPYVDARVIQDRLDEVLGVMHWQDCYNALPDGAVVCELTIRVAGEWVTKVDVGGESEQSDPGDRRKAAFSDALKRAAVKFGIGRYLYRQKPLWCDYDPTKRQFTRLPILPGVNTAAAPAAPTATGKDRPADPAPVAAPPWTDGLDQADNALAAKGYSKRGELKHAVWAMGKAMGYPTDLDVWDASQIAAASAVSKAFEKARKELAKT